MRKRKPSIIRRCLFFISQLVIIALCSVIIISTVYEFTDAKLFEEAVKETHVKAYNTFIYNDDNSSVDTVKRIRNFVLSQPDQIIAQFDAQKWKVILSSDFPKTLLDSATFSSSGEYNESVYSVMSGLMISKAKVIYVNNQLKDEDMVFSSFVHEFGHYIDYIHGYISVSEEFTELYKACKGSELFDEYESSSTLEFFASSYAKYHTSADELKNKLPSLYKYFDNLNSAPIPYSNIFTRVYSNNVGMIRLLMLNVEANK